MPGIRYRPDNAAADFAIFATMEQKGDENQTVKGCPVSYPDRALPIAQESVPPDGATKAACIVCRAVAVPRALRIGAMGLPAGRMSSSR
jgi:hypothetical protein